ncbi:hypothetical protein F4861DRAFT_490410 [Xylaria intraflava]|nr:hypothetical protein F4861DRAFT_490410 [Xylaria intraflava]
MQRVSSLLPSWDWNRSSVGSLSSNHTHNSTDKIRGWSDKISSTRSSRQVKEAFWPATLDKECEKAARILKSFCSDGFATPEERPGSPLTYASPQSPARTLKKIPPKLVQNAVGMAIFTSIRSGIWASGPGGSGILIARKTDGSWSPPSGLVLQTPSLGFVIGVDVCDCVLLINNFTVLEAFARPKFTLGTDVILAAGPLVSLGLLENDVTWTDLSDAATTYVKANGQFSEIKMDGTILQERRDENERFYGMTLGVAKILSGDINQSLPQLRSLTEMLKAAEGRVDYDTVLVESISPHSIPGDATIDSVTTPLSPPVFGLPAVDDPDPFGVLALEMAGIGIREAGSHTRPESSQFEYRPSPTSPVFPKVKRRSVDTIISCSNRSNRGSYMSSRTGGTEKSQTTDACTQTFSTTPATTPTRSQSQSEDGHQQHSSDEVHEAKESVEIEYTMIDISSLRKLSNFPDLEEPEKLPNIHDAPASTTAEEKTENDGKEESKLENEMGRRPLSSVDENESYADDEEDAENGNSSTYDEEDVDIEDDGESDSDDELEDEEAIVIEVATAQAPTRVAMAGTQVMQAKGAVVNIPKRVPPPLPTRSAARSSRRRSQIPDTGSMVGSPLRKEFDPDETSDITTTDTPNIPESTTDAMENEVSRSSDSAVETTVSEDRIDLPGSIVTQVLEPPMKRASGIVHAASAEEQVNLTTGHQPAVAIAS